MNSIHQFLQQNTQDFLVFDLGRRIQPVPVNLFEEFETGKIQWPWPLQQQAWLGMMLQSTKSSDVAIWFVRLPLDSRGYLDVKIHTDFLQRLQQSEQSGDQENNPYGFKPKPEQMAVFHAKVSAMLQQPPSRFYAHARDYFAGVPGFDQWAFVGFQGIADMAARWSQDDNEKLLAAALTNLPPQPFEALCQCVEHEAAGDILSAALLQKLDQLLAQNETDASLIAYCLRALSGSTVCEVAMQTVLRHRSATHPDLLAAMAGRCWAALADDQRMLIFLENLAQCAQGQEFFTAIVVDLINIPGMQTAIHQAMRHPQRTAELGRAIGGMFRQFS